MNLKKPVVHIYTLSRLVHAPAGGWERKIEEIEEGRDKAYSYYQPMREAVIAYCAAKGKGREKIVSRMLADARSRPHGHGQDPEGDNLRAFETFETSCYPKIGSFVCSLLRRPQGTGVPLEGVLLQGAPHFRVTDKDGETRYVFLHPSNWTAENLKAYLELLSFIVEAAYGAPSASIWHMNLRSGRVSKYGSSKRVRQRCVDAARLYARIFAPKN
jgi:hypothetical protein